MYIWQLFLAIILITIFVLCIPEIFPKCSCCRKFKPRFLFSIHKLTGIAPGYRGNTSVCKKCCRQYYINDVIDLQNVTRIRKTLRSRL